MNTVLMLYVNTCQRLTCSDFTFTLSPRGSVCYYGKNRRDVDHTIEEDII